MSEKKNNVNFVKSESEGLKYEKSDMGSFISEEAKKRKRNIRTVSSGENFQKAQADKAMGKKSRFKKSKPAKAAKTPKKAPAKAAPKKAAPTKTAPKTETVSMEPVFKKREVRSAQTQTPEPPKKAAKVKPKPRKKRPGRKIPVVKILLFILAVIVVGVGGYQVRKIYMKKQAVEQKAREEAQAQEQAQNVKKNQWVEADGKRYYYGEDGMPTIGRFILDQKIYYTNTRGAVERVIDGNKPMIALTFDDGPTEVSEGILDVLEEYDAQATFFEIGNRIDGHEDIEERIVDARCQIGNHTYTNKLSQTDDEQIAEQIADTDNIIKDYLDIPEEEDGEDKDNKEDLIYVRTPDGVLNDTILANVNHPIILWSVDTQDWSDPDADSIFEKATSNVSDGDIIMLTALKKPTVEAVRKIVPALERQGYQLVTVRDLAQFRGGVEKGKAYTAFPPSGAKTTTVTPAATTVTTEQKGTTATTAARATAGMTAASTKSKKNDPESAVEPTTKTTTEQKKPPKKPATTAKPKPTTESPSTEAPANPGDSQTDGED